MLFFSKNGLRLPSIISLLLLIFFGLCLLGTGDASLVKAAAGDQLYLTILHTNDEHGAFIPHSPTVDYHPERENPTVGGYARLASAVKQIRQKKEAVGEPVLLFSAGDYLGESPYSWLIPMGYAAEMEFKHIIGYDAVIIGNHEYDYGSDILASYYLKAGYPDAHDQTVILASNTVAPPDHVLSREGLYRESHIKVLENGLKVGLFGLIGKRAVSATTNNEPVGFTDQHETARLMVEELKQQGAQMIIAITHASEYEDQDLARAVPGIHVIIGGHSHAALYEPIVEGDTVIVQAGSQLRYLGQLELAFNPATGEVRIRNRENDRPFLIPLDHTIPLDPEIKEMVESYTAVLNTLLVEKTGGAVLHVLDTVMVTNFEIPTLRLQESPLGNFITDAMRLVTEEKTGKKADFALQANGAIRGSVIPGTMPHSLGKVSVYDLSSLVGLGIGPDGDAGYSIVAAYLTGEEIRRVLEVAVLLSEMMGDTYFLQFSGLRYDYNPQNAILLTVPFIDQPIPSTMVFPGGAVVKAERYTGESNQNDEDNMYVPLDRGDEELYCLISDTYIVSFLPMIGDLLPQLSVVLKDSDGNPVSENELEKLIVRVDGEELKVWATVLEYAAGQLVGVSGLPEADAYYASTAGRINQAWSIPYITWPILILLLIVIAIVLLVRRRKLRRRKAGK